jgi:hypothetical protein
MGRRWISMSNGVGGMTYEEAKKILKSLIPKPVRCDGKSATHLQITEALLMGMYAIDCKEKTVKDIFDSYTDEQKEILFYMTGKVLEIHYIAKAIEVVNQMNEAERSVFWYLVGCAIEDGMKSNKEDEN